LAEEDPRICAITAAMPAGTGLLPFKKKYPKRLFDVGIAEEHAVSMAGGLAKQGMIPVVALYSTFLQRSYDMILQDICLLKLHAVLAVDRAGLVGEDGETHHGVFDVGFLRQAPGMAVLCPASQRELQDMLSWAVLSYDGPIAVRYPRGGDRDYVGSAWKDGKNNVFCHKKGTDVTLVTYGTLVQNAMDAAEILQEQGFSASVLRLMSISPLPVKELFENLPESHKVFVLEETCTGSGIAQALAWELGKLSQDCQVESIDLGKHYVTHGSVNKLYEAHGLDGQSVVNTVMEVLSR
jgi:1-deoxy-D-xylulose-5-phosphate synthase